MLCKISLSVRLSNEHPFSSFPIVFLQSDSVVDSFSLKQKPCVLILLIFMVVPKKNLISSHKNPCSSIFKYEILTILHQEKSHHHFPISPTENFELFSLIFRQAFLSPSPLLTSNISECKPEDMIQKQRHRFDI